MSLDLNTVDIDGAIRDSAEDAGLDRAAFFKKAGVAGAGAIAGASMFGPFLGNAEAAISTRRKSLRNDIKIGNFALTLEFLEAEIYKQANANKPFRDDRYRVFSEVTGAHENAHVRALRKLLRSSAVKKPTFDFADATRGAKFNATAQVLEDAGVAAYLGQAANIAQRAVLNAAGTIVTVEARHAAWIRFLNGGGAAGAAVAARPAPLSFDRPASERAILRAVTGTGFIKG